MEYRHEWKHGIDRPSSGITVETFVLLGISVLVLSGGLMIAIKVKH